MSQTPSLNISPHLIFLRSFKFIPILCDTLQPILNLPTPTNAQFNEGFIFSSISLLFKSFNFLSIALQLGVCVVVFRLNELYSQLRPDSLCSLNLVKKSGLMGFYHPLMLGLFRLLQNLIKCKSRLLIWQMKIKLHELTLLFLCALTGMRTLINSIRSG